MVSFMIFSRGVNPREGNMGAKLSPIMRTRSTSPRALLYTLLVAFNALLWLLLWAFHWEISLRAREVQYFGRQLFPIRSQAVPLPVIYTACALLTIASAGVILRDRSNLAVREKLQTLLEQILESLEIGVLVLDKKGFLSLANESARKLLPKIPATNSDVHFLEVLRDYPELREIVRSGLDEGNLVKELEHDLGSAEEPCTVRITTLPLKDRQKRAGGILLLVNDVREVVAMERQMRAAERLSTLGTLAAALAHEIRNPLEAMNLNLELLGRSLEVKRTRATEGDNRQKYVKVLEDEVSRLGWIVENFLSFARPGQPPVTNIRLDEILHRVVELIRNQAKFRRVETELSIDGQAIPVQGSEDQLKQVFLNLIINSLEAMPDGGRLFIRAETACQPSSQGSMRSAIVRIQDSGEGIPPDRIPRLFDPFFSTRPRGTGLGLTIAHRVVREHRGHIRVESKPGNGSVFTVVLPLALTEN
jgi:signal transduction histidine kinase